MISSTLLIGVITIVAFLTLLYVIYRISKRDSINGSLSTLPENIKTIGRRLSLSMDLQLLEDTTTECSSLTMTELPQESPKRYLRVGLLVIQLPTLLNTPGMRLPGMLRNTLIALLIFLQFMPTVRFLRSSSEVETRLSEVCLNLRKKYVKYSLIALVRKNGESARWA